MAGAGAQIAAREHCFELARDLSDENRASVGRAAKVVRNMVLTAAITAPPDLWVLRQVLAAHQIVITLASATFMVDGQRYTHTAEKPLASISRLPHRWLRNLMVFRPVVLKAPRPCDAY